MDLHSVSNMVFKKVEMHFQASFFNTYAVEGANRIAGKLSFVILNSSFKIFEDEFFIFLDKFC